MSKVSAHFSRSEFACKCGCGLSSVSPALVVVLEAVRNHFDAPVIINSACRCPAYNEEIGGVLLSQHLLGTAADIRVEGRTPQEVADWLELQYPDRYGIGLYRTFTHIDVRPARCRWRGLA